MISVSIVVSITGQIRAAVVSPHRRGSRRRLELVTAPEAMLGQRPWSSGENLVSELLLGSHWLTGAELKPTKQVKGERRFSYTMLVNEEWVMVFDMQAYYKLDDVNWKVKWEEPASRGRRSILGGLLLWRHIIQDIDFKLGGAERGFIYLKSRSRPTARWVHRAYTQERVGGANLNQCPLVD